MNSLKTIQSAVLDAYKIIYIYVTIWFFHNWELNILTLKCYWSCRQGKWDEVRKNEFQELVSGRSLSTVTRFSWSEIKSHALGDVEGGQALVATAPRPLLILHVFPWFGEHTGCLSNCPTCFLGFSCGSTGPSFPVSFLNLRGFCAFNPWGPFPSFSQARLPLFMSPVWLLLSMPHSSALSSGF